MFTWNWVVPNALAAGSLPIDTENIRELHASGIRSILTLTEHPLTERAAVGSNTIAQLGIDYRHVPIPDNYPPDDAQTEEIIAYIDQMQDRGKPLFFHCLMGMGRTGTIMHLYFLAHGLPIDQVRTRVYQARPECVNLTAVQKAYVEQYAAKQFARGKTIL